MLALRRERGGRAFETRGTPLMVCGCESVARFPGWSAIITRSGQNGNLPLHPINRQQAYYTGIPCILQAFSTPCANFFSSFSAHSSPKLRSSYASRRFSMSPLSGVSIVSAHFGIPAKKHHAGQRKICPAGKNISRVKTPSAVQSPPACHYRESYPYPLRSALSGCRGCFRLRRADRRDLHNA